MRLRMILGWIGIALVGASYLQAAMQEPSSAAPLPVSPQRALLNRYCVTCHNEKLRTADLLLDKMEVEKVSEGVPVWEKVVRKLRTRAMPPPGMPRPDEATYDSIAEYLETALDPRGGQPSPIPAGQPSTVSTVLNTPTRSATCSRLIPTRLIFNRFFPPTIRATALTTLGMSSRYPRCCWNDTCQRRGRSTASLLGILRSVRIWYPTMCPSSSGKRTA